MRAIRTRREGAAFRLDEGPALLRRHGTDRRFIRQIDQFPTSLENAKTEPQIPRPNVLSTKVLALPFEFSRHPRRYRSIGP